MNAITVTRKVECSAIQWIGDNFYDILDFLGIDFVALTSGAPVTIDQTKIEIDPSHIEDLRMYDRTGKLPLSVIVALNPKFKNVVAGSVGSWFIRESDGNLYVCTAQQFDETFTNAEINIEKNVEPIVPLTEKEREDRNKNLKEKYGEMFENIIPGEISAKLEENVVYTEDGRKVKTSKDIINDAQKINDIKPEFKSNNNRKLSEEALKYLKSNLDEVSEEKIETEYQPDPKDNYYPDMSEINETDEEQSDIEESVDEQPSNARSRYQQYLEERKRKQEAEAEKEPEPEEEQEDDDDIITIDEVIENLPNYDSSIIDSIYEDAFNAVNSIQLKEQTERLDDDDVYALDEYERLINAIDKFREANAVSEDVTEGEPEVEDENPTSESSEDGTETINEDELDPELKEALDQAAEEQALEETAEDPVDEDVTEAPKPQDYYQVRRTSTDATNPRLLDYFAEQFENRNGKK